MKSLFEPTTVQEVEQRIGALTPTSAALWGKMSAPQMLAHCATDVEALVNDKPHPRALIGRVIGPLFRSEYFNDKPMRKNSPTVATLIMKGEHDLAAEQNRLIAVVERFSSEGPEKCSKGPHCFFGKMSAEEWAKGMYKHLDHHLQQFGV